LENRGSVYHINQMITLSVISFGGFHCITFKMDINKFEF
jgi:hypothetical protein